jgi:hypothetical protein
MLPLLLACVSLFPAAQETPTDAEVEKAWEALEPEQKKEIAEWFRQEAKWLRTFQQGLIDYVLANQTQDPGLYPIAEPPTSYDPLVHAPRQPIRRKPLLESSAAVRKKREQFFFRVPERKLDSAWIHDYASGEVRRTQRLDDPDRICHNALRGFPPDLDLAEALVEMQLDRGEEREALTAFAHSYTDRQGRVFGELTLYDAWASASDMEMPDVDSLGVYHDLVGDSKRYVAPVPASRHDALYEKIGELFADAHHYRGLRHAMAMCYLTGYPSLRDGYGANLERLHSLWDDQESTPAKMKETLPSSKKWERFLDSWAKKVDRSKERKKKGEERRDTLHADGQRVRAKWIEVMRAAGALPEK